MKRVGFIFGGRSGEHEVSLMSAAEVIGAAGNADFEIVKIGIDKDGKWYLYEGNTAGIACGTWKAAARPCSAYSCICLVLIWNSTICPSGVSTVVCKL